MGEMREKMYYSISEVCDETGLEQHVLRYWETEFPNLKPKKNRAGNRAYRERDIETILTIKHLLYEEQYTIPGAKKKLTVLRENQDTPEKETDHKELIKETIEGLQGVLKVLGKK